MAAIPFYFATALARFRRAYARLSLLLGLTLVVHSLHHLLAFLGLPIPALGADQVSALLALVFGILYYTTWRSEAVR